MRKRITVAVATLLSIIFGFTACTMNINEKISPPAWIQHTWEGAEHKFTFSEHEMVHVTKNSASGGFVASSSAVQIEVEREIEKEDTHTIYEYKVEVTKGGSTEKYRFVNESTDPNTLVYYTEFDGSGFVENMTKQ